MATTGALPEFPGCSVDTDPVAPLVSVVVPVYDGLPYLREALDSVLRQTHTELELVIADGGSRDASRAVIEELSRRDERVRIVDGAPGAAANWTAVTEQARGEFVKLLCQDDRLAPDALARQIADLTAHPNAVMAVAQRDIIDARGRMVSRARGLQGIEAGERDVQQLVRRCYDFGTNVIGEPLTVLFRRDALRTAMPWDDTQPLMLDVVTYERVADLHPGATAIARRESVGAFRVSTSSWSTRIADEQLDQYRAWQHAYADRHPGITPAERGEADRGARRQARRRRLAYAALRLRGGLAART